MRAEEIVKAVYANARLEPHKTNGGQRYYLIRRGREHMYYAEGKTPSEAWKEALTTLIEEMKRSLAPAQTKGDGK